MVLVNELKSSEIGASLDPRFFEVLPTVCESCGSPYNLNLALTELSCINPSCGDKVVMRTRKICEAYGIKHFGESSIEKWVEAEGIVNPLKIFDVYEGKLLGGLTDTLSDKIVPQILACRSMKLWEFVANAQLPYIQSSAKTLLEGYSSLEDFYSDMEDGGVEFIQGKLGIKDSYDNFGNPIVSVQAMKVFTSLEEYKEELLEGAEYVTFIEEGNLREYLIVASDEVGGDFKTKREFYNFIKQRYSGLVDFTIGSSVTKKTDIVVWKGFDDTPARLTTKVKRAYELDAQGVEIQGYTAKEFIEAFDEALGIK
jgi:DNA ligase (NAD+)